MTNAVNIAQSGSNNQTMRNRIINGAMTISQRNGTSSVTITSDGQYSLDRWISRNNVTSKVSIQQNAGSVTPPAGFTNYLGITSLSAYSSASSNLFTISQRIEGFNTADFAWGTASAQPVTLSFWVRSSLTGTFGGSFINSATSRAYVFQYTINSANTWEYKTITVAGDMTGTWLTDNGTGVQVNFDLGSGSNWNGTANAWQSGELYRASGNQSVVGTNGATWQVTGVQLEEGTAASPFENRLYTTELQLCQRYACSTFPQGTAWGQNKGINGAISLMTQNTSARQLGYFTYPVTMRAAPTFTSYNPSAANAQWWNDSAGTSVGNAVFTASTGDRGIGVFTESTPSNVSNVYLIHASASAEL
jgi:hypothetical protein